MKNVKEKAEIFFAKAPYLARINNKEEYEQAQKLLADLIEQQQALGEMPLLMDVLVGTIERWESQALEMEVFNRRVDKLDDGVAALRVIMEQYGLGGADLPEIGSKSLVSKILKGERGLTRKHILGLSERFDINPNVFF